jgi:hypothetical protein
LIKLEREHLYDYDDIDDMTEKIMKEIKKIMKKDNANKKWEDFVIKVDSTMTLDSFRSLFYSHFNAADIHL